MRKQHTPPSYTVEQVTRAARHQCWDCGMPTAPYMVHNEVWKAAWPDGEPARRRLSTLATKLFPNRRNQDPQTHRVLVSINLCFGCLEKRLGRHLTVDDFQRFAKKSGNRIYVNDGIFMGYRIGLRVTAKKAAELGDKKDEGG